MFNFKLKFLVNTTPFDSTCECSLNTRLGLYCENTENKNFFSGTATNLS